MNSENIYVCYDKEAQEILVAYKNIKEAENYKKRYQYPDFIVIEKIALILNVN